MAGFSVTNADQVNGVTANFTTVNTADSNLTGSTFFANASDIQVNGSLMIQPGAGAGKVLTSDASGNATWQASGAGADHMGNHIARQALDMNGFSLFNADQVNGTTANFTNLTMTSGYSFFNGGTTTQFNGSVIITTGASNGFILTSDANGVASWQAAPSGADNLGNHTASQALAMAGFSVTNADQVNGVTGNFTDLNVVGSTIFGNASNVHVNGTLIIPAGAANGYVLSSDANGVATWISSAALTGTGDNLGTHIATQALAMAGFSIRNADQVNGATGNFDVANINGSLLYENGASAGFVLSSDATGNATWVDPSTLASNGDNLGNHTATQALAMAGF